MQNNTLQQFVDVIRYCILSIKNGDVLEAEPWILLEEKIGYDETIKLYESIEYRKLFYLLEDYCLNAQLGFVDVKSEHSSITETILLKCTDRIGDIEFIDRELEK